MYGFDEYSFYVLGYSCGTVWFLNNLFGSPVYHGPLSWTICTSPLVSAKFLTARDSFSFDRERLRSVEAHGYKWSMPSLLDLNTGILYPHITESMPNEWSEEEKLDHADAILNRRWRRMYHACEQPGKKVLFVWIGYGHEEHPNEEYRIATHREYSSYYSPDIARHTLSILRGKFLADIRLLYVERKLGASCIRVEDIEDKLMLCSSNILIAERKDPGVQYVGETVYNALKQDLDIWMRT